MVDRPLPPPVNCGIPVSPLLLEWIAALSPKLMDDHEKKYLKELIEGRCRYGMEKYGQKLMSQDGRNEVIDAEQEAGDLLQYSFKARMNGRTTELNARMRPVLTAILIMMAHSDEEVWEVKISPGPIPFNVIEEMSNFTPTPCGISEIREDYIKFIGTKEQRDYMRDHVDEIVAIVKKARSQANTLCTIDISDKTV